MKKNTLITLIIILIVVFIAIFLLNKETPSTEKEIVKCIGEKSTLYVQLGCHACGTQEAMFREDYQYLKVIDCFYERDKCADIQKTPTWIISGEKYEGVQSIEELQKLTGC